MRKLTLSAFIWNSDDPERPSHGSKDVRQARKSSAGLAVGHVDAGPEE